MIAATDVQYFEGEGAQAACLVFSDWADPEPISEHCVWLDSVEPYEPGAFYKRELPCLLAVLEPILPQVSLIVVDGYVWLGDESTPGLGARLFSALDGKIPVVGVAKTRFAGAAPVAEVLRGESASPLFVSSVGLELAEATKHVARMHGAHRIPALLKRVDQRARRR
jgi:deoxyribonuclease V